MSASDSPGAARPERRDFLFELGTEELPPRSNPSPPRGASRCACADSPQRSRTRKSAAAVRR